MKIAVIIVRILLGLLLLFSSVVVLFKLVPQPEAQGAIKTFNEGLAASIYLMPLIKVTELICAIAFLSGWFVPLAAVVLFPITVNIVLFHAFLAPEGLPVVILVLLANLFLAYAYRKHYVSLVAPK
jgi:uncharacterized membrane protein YphA (DoxX/SURF4 family)